MKLFAVVTVLAGVFAGNGYAAPQLVYLGDNYDLLNAEALSVLNILGPQALDYILQGIASTNTLKLAVESGNRRAVVQQLLDGGAATKEGAYHAIEIPALYKLLTETGPNEGELLADEVAVGIKGGRDVTNAVGLLAAQLREAVQYPYHIN